MAFRLLSTAKKLEKNLINGIKHGTLNSPKVKNDAIFHQYKHL